MAALIASICLLAQTGTPQMKMVEPGSGKVGDVLTVTGENLGKDAVAELFLTDGKNDFKVVIAAQEPTAIKFKIPASAAKSGRLALMILTTGKDPKLIEQPVKITIEE